MHPEAVQQLGVFGEPPGEVWPIAAGTLDSPGGPHYSMQLACSKRVEMATQKVQMGGETLHLGGGAEVLARCAAAIPQCACRSMLSARTL